MLAATDRYVLDLGRIDLRQTGSRKYRLANLPESEFVLGIDISPTADTKQAINQESVKAVVAIELIPLKGEPIFSRTGPLNTWTWSSRDSGRQVFVYGREAPQTYFKPEPNAAYTLALTIVQPDKEGATYAASLKAKAGGWK